MTNNFAAVLRQQIDESNHDMVQMLAQIMSAIFNPLIQDKTKMNQQMEPQMTHIVDFFGVPQSPRHPQRGWTRENQGIAVENDLTINQVPRNAPQVNMVNQGIRVEPPRVEAPRAKQQIPREPRIVLENRHQDANELIK